MPHFSSPNATPQLLKCHTSTVGMCGIWVGQVWHSGK